MDKQFDKKRLMYNKSEDLYFVTYNIILILYYLGSVNKEKVFKDYRKLAFIIPIISDDKNITILLDYYKGKLNPNKNIQSVINRLYYDSIENIILIRYVLMILEKKEIIILVNEANKTNLYINKIEDCEKLASNTMFNREASRILKLKKGVSSIRTLKYITFVDNFFKRNGVAIWENY